MKFLSTALSGAIALAFAQSALAQGAVNIHPKTGDISVEQSGVQNSQQIGEGNQSSQVYGNQNQTTTQSGTQNQSNTQSGSDNTAGNTTQSGTQNQSAIGTGNQQNQQYGTGNQSTQSGAGSTAANEQNRQYGDRDSASSGASTEDDKPGNQGWHKGWAKNKHRDEASGKYDPNATSGSSRDSDSSYGGTRWR